MFEIVVKNDSPSSWSVLCIFYVLGLQNKVIKLSSAFRHQFRQLENTSLGSKVILWISREQSHSLEDLVIDFDVTSTCKGDCTCLLSSEVVLSSEYFYCCSFFHTFIVIWLICRWSFLCFPCLTLKNWIVN